MKFSVEKQARRKLLNVKLSHDMLKPVVYLDFDHFKASEQCFFGATCVMAAHV